MAEKLGLVSDDDREVMRRWARDLPQIESFDNGTPEWRNDMTAWINSLRAASGIPPLKEWWENKTEPELHERAKSLGLLRRVR